MKKHLLCDRSLTYRKSISFVTLWLLVGLYAFSTANVFGQEVRQLDNFLSTHSSSTEKEQQEKANLEQLLLGLRPTLYLQSGELIQPDQSAALRITTDVQSAKLLNEENPLFSKVEVVRINIDSQGDLTFSFNLDNLPSLENLKYVVFRCSFDICEGQPEKNACEVKKILTMFHSASGKAITILYQIISPS